MLDKFFIQILVTSGYKNNGSINTNLKWGIVQKIPNVNGFKNGSLSNL